MSQILKNQRPVVLADLGEMQRSAIGAERERPVPLEYECPFFIRLAIPEANHLVLKPATEKPRAFRVEGQKRCGIGKVLRQGGVRLDQ